MKILQVNKFLHWFGGSETYCFKLSDHLMKQGHEVQFFGMDHARNVKGNSLGLSVSNVEFKKMSLKKINYPFRIIYSFEAKNKIRQVIEAFKPDIIHLNNINFQLTPSILYEIKKHNIPVVMTLHDFQLVCPNHMLYLEHEARICEDCKGRKYFSCVTNNCLHDSKIKSMLAAFEGFLHHKLKSYDDAIDMFIAPSRFLKQKFVEFGESASRIKVISNFIDQPAPTEAAVKGDYILYFGRLSVQKGIRTLLEAMKRLPHLKLVVAGEGDLEKEIAEVPNVEYVGFRTGEELNDLIKRALFTIYPSEWYENCPMSVLESQMYGTPVIGANIGGIPELVEHRIDGLLFTPGDVHQLADSIRYLYENRDVLEEYSRRCVVKVQKFSIDRYYAELMTVYESLLHKAKEEGA
ncbi:glycosyltransferase family 4 protein [Paenibacillus silvisoli]|uniref:glycosyltransferase family 4 protein n=1 Tax=Paenibacillus silvisoli TaxID=3110539 RepID=UPI002803C941|nr:glycosyltransferase family 4 protein [Paenibacillus silvisoli]